MASFDLYSKRRKRLKGEIQDIFTYDQIPNKIRIQIVHIIESTIGKIKYGYYGDHATAIYNKIDKVICKEYGLLDLPGHSSLESKYKIRNYFLNFADDEQALDIIELFFKIIYENIVLEYDSYCYSVQVDMSPSEAIIELNDRFKENSLGYSFENNELIRIDSTYMHANVTKNVIRLIANYKFDGVNEEYMKAHDHYKNGRNKECLVECLKAFESTLKIICNEKKWAINSGDSVKKIINVCFNNGLLPTYQQTQYAALINLLESGIPTLRNKIAGHGQGKDNIIVENETTRYGLNITGSSIIYLIDLSEK